MADVFLSYARSDAAAAARVARELARTGRSVWYDRELPPHQAYSDVIERELENANAVLVLWSEAAIESQWVRSEANRARELGKLVQGRLSNTRLPMPFDQIQCADLSNWRRGGSQVQRSIDALVGRDPAELGAARSSGANRRQLMTGAAAAGAAAITAGGWWLLREKRSVPQLAPETAALMTQARSVLWQNTPEGQNQAIGIYKQIVAENPNFAEAWGRLAMSYAWTSHWRAADEARELRQRARSAGEHALALDPRDVHAITGLAVAKPFLGNWLEINRELKRAVTFDPQDGEANFSLAMTLSMSGYVREALRHVGLIMKSGPTPGIYVWTAQMLWSAGRQDELDALLDEATKLYPTHFGVWFTRFYTFMMGGRPDAAIAFAANIGQRPTSIPSEEIESVTRVAKAIETHSEPKTEMIVKEWTSRAHHGAGYAENAAQFMAALGRVDAAFVILRAYYFAQGFDPGEARFSGSIGSFTARNDRQTAFLFNPAMAPVRSDLRFAILTGQLHLQDYWHATGRNPDYFT